MEKALEYEEAYKKIDSYIIQRSHIENLIELIPNSSQRAIIKYKYLNNLYDIKIADKMVGKNYKSDTLYLRTT
ncbi:MAG: hypothetical protein Q4E50_07235 [Tissierellia bacterium]|nr:hypothetical protein [Tissierellia bacterium]